ncbi:alpha/beta hydrolase [Thaumasiovibrio subtropicus]|uniref:alpha/beta hydrolase n=1 Tax=Thaumasiovibrio subtropicus TaxID=1891207 RepID=UPI000B36203F|nr:carboxylesterase [Thaumasiovibrio subtropicus]
MSSKRELIPHVLVEPANDPDACVIWLHGLGADGHDFEPVVPELGLPADAAVRFIFPHASAIPVTVNAGLKMSAWFDILSAGVSRTVNKSQLIASARAIENLIEDQIEKGIKANRIVIAGFSQGGAVAYHTALGYDLPLGGLLTMSTYFATREDVQFTEANRQIPVRIMHGDFDPVVLPNMGLEARDALVERGYDVQWTTYPMAHQVTMPQIIEIGRWLSKVLCLK